MRRTSLYLAVLGCCSSLFSPAALKAQDTIVTSRAFVEVLGLRSWSIPQMRDSLKKYSPETDLDRGVCAAILRKYLHFPEAVHTTRFVKVQDRELHLITLSIIEPGDTNMLRYLPVPRQAQPDRAEWREAIALTRVETQFFEALQGPSLLNLVGSLGRNWRPYSGFALDTILANFLASKNRRSDRDTALSVLRSDANSANRMVAAAILLNFADNEDTWRTLARYLRDRDQHLSIEVGLVLTAMARQRPRGVNWLPEVESLKALLAGTNLVAFETVVEILNATKVDSRVLKPLFFHNTRMLGAKLGTRDPGRREALLELLSKAAGHEVQDVPSEWRRLLQQFEAGLAAS